LKLIHINPASLTSNSISKSVNIYAPISGMITKIDVNIGKYVNATDMLFQIMDNQSMYAKLNVFEKDAANLAIGQKLKVYTNTQPDVFMRLKLNLLTKVIRRKMLLKCMQKFQIQRKINPWKLYQCKYSGRDEQCICC